MLVLSRHKNEAVMVGDNIRLTIVDIRGDKVRLGIDAPQEVPVHRQEVYDAILREHGKVPRKDSVQISKGDEFEFCSKALATQHYDFNYEEWVVIDHEKASRFDCQLYRREVTTK